MFNQFTALFNTSLKPIDQLVKLNITTANTVAHQQGLLIASLVDGSASFSKNMFATKNISDFITEQSKFNTDVRNQLTETMSQTSGAFTKAQKDVGIILNNSFSILSTKVNESTPVISNQPIKEKTKASVKETPKASVKATPKAIVKAAPKAAVKVAPKAIVKATPKAAVKSAPKAAVKVAPKAIVKATPKAAVKSAPKATVKAAPKAAVKAAPKATVKVAPKAIVKAAPKAAVKAAPKAAVKAASTKPDVAVSAKK